MMNLFKKHTDTADNTADTTTDIKLWRITAHRLQMIQNSNGYMIGASDHFTVKAASKAEAIGIFKMRQDGMKWYVIDVSPEQIMDASQPT